MRFILHPRIRRFEQSDLRGVLRIERESFGRDAWPREAFLAHASAAPEFFLVATLAGRIAGYCIASLTRHGAEIDSIAVLPHFRGRGIASALLNAMLRKLKRAGAPAVSLMVRRRNEEAIRLYRSFGFVRVATVPNYYGGRATGWRMKWTLV